ncbi:transposase [Streptomyces mirabilis]|uniref:transposase n=1 Tax=Streptomyces mirabilis TaxID=68239 RepID=UPI0036D7863D
MKIFYATTRVGSLDSRFRKASRGRGHFPNDQAALRVLCCVIRDRQAQPHRPDPLEGSDQRVRRLLRRLRHRQPVTSPHDAEEASPSGLVQRP